MHFRPVIKLSDSYQDHVFSCLRYMCLLGYTPTEAGETLTLGSNLTDDQVEVILQSASRLARNNSVLRKFSGSN